MILQFWRNIGESKMDFPLAFCDARTVAPADGRPIPVTDYAGSGVDFEALALLAPTDAAPYRWFAFPELRHDEAVAFRTYDTELVERGETWFTPHSAFRDPDVEVGQPARNSIELQRSVCTADGTLHSSPSRRWRSSAIESNVIAPVAASSSRGPRPPANP